MNVDINIEHLFISLNIMKVFFIIIDHSILKIKYKFGFVFNSIPTNIKNIYLCIYKSYFFY